MILVDSSVWIDHLRRPDEVLVHLLDQEQVMVHPFVIGELAMGHLQSRHAILADLRDLRHSVVADHEEVLRFVAEERLFGIGLGYIDAHLLSSARLTPETKLWTRDRLLATAATRLALAAHITH